MNKPTDLVAAVAELTLALHAIRTAQISPIPGRTAVAVLLIRAAVAQLDDRGALVPACGCTPGDYRDDCPTHGSGVPVVSQPHGAERDWK